MELSTELLHQDQDQELTELSTELHHQDQDQDLVVLSTEPHLRDRDQDQVVLSIELLHQDHQLQAQDLHQVDNLHHHVQAEVLTVEVRVVEDSAEEALAVDRHLEVLAVAHLQEEAEVDVNKHEIWL
jgi:hypothetical protein